MMTADETIAAANLPPPVIVEGDINVEGLPGGIDFYKKLDGLDNAIIGDEYRWEGGVVSLATIPYFWTS